MRAKFDEAHRVLDEVEKRLAHAGAKPRIRYRLERGRAFNSAGDKAAARAQFVAAWNEAAAAGLDGLAVDAAHMVAITHSGTSEALPWNERGLALARASGDAKARALIPAMLNNSAWDLHDMGRFAEALPRFEEALREWTARDKVRQIRIARWSVARCLRSLGRFEEALEAQRALEREYASEGEVDPSVREEIAANLAALGRPR